MRAVHKYSYVLELDHYLEVLTRKPGALAGATALANARKSGVFTATHQRFWDKARAGLGDGPGTRALVEVLLLGRSLPAPAIQAAMEQALASGDFDSEHVTVTARTSAANTTRAAAASPESALPAEVAGRIIHLPERARPSLSQYDQLLTTAGGRS